MATDLERFVSAPGRDDPVKDVRQQVDAAGVTAEFNRNVLHVVNRELSADFVPDRFDHVARFNPDEEWIEMWLRSTADQQVTVADLGLTVVYAAGEAMRTEISAKFNRQSTAAMLQAAGFRMTEWMTSAGAQVALAIAAPVA